MGEAGGSLAAPRARRGAVGAAAALALLATGAALAATVPVVKYLDVAVATPVYVLPRGLPAPSGRYDYQLSWSGIPVGRVRIDMRPRIGTGAEADAGSDAAPGARGAAVEVDILGATHPAIDWLWRYRFEGHGRVHTDPFAPGGFVVDECENRDHQRTEIRFGEAGSRVRGIRLTRGRVKEYVFTSSNTFDLPSSVYLVLGLDYAPGARFALDTFTGKSRYLVTILVDGREALAHGPETTDAWRLRITSEELTDDDPEGRHRETFVWVSAERPRRLLRARSETFVGSIQLELVPADAAAPVGATCA
jgi:hypothetical protein